MGRTIVNRITGAERVNTPFFIITILLLAFAMGFLVIKMGLLVGGAIIAMPIVLYGVNAIFKDAGLAIFAALIVSFMVAGLALYVKGPFGLGIDITLVFAWLSIFFKHFRHIDWSPLDNNFTRLGIVWFGLLVLEIINPDSNGPVAWFYAVRAIGLYPFLGMTAVMMLLRHPKYLDKFLNIVFIFSLLGTAWGFRQMIGGTNAAEDHWLYAEEHADQHILFGKLRVFSFYSDAGQFGSSQAYVAAVCFISALAPTLKMKKKMLLVIIGVITFMGFGISGTRGALAVPAVAGFMFLIFSKQVKILILGVAMAGGAFYVLKYTKAFQSIEQVARMRSGLSGENASLEVRLNNQRYFYKLLKTRPIGAGIGTAGYWADKYNPHGKWAVPTDSYYVRIWAETGIVGICLHFIFFGYIFGRGGFILWHLKNQELRYKMIALYGGFAGVLATSYGNAVYSQLPSAMVMIISLPMIFLAPLYDKILAQDEIKEKVKRKEELTYEEQVLLAEKLK